MARALLMVLWLCLVSEGSWAGDAMEILLSTNPKDEAERFFATGDKRHIVLPVCRGAPGGEVIPGWPLENTPAVQDAIERGRRPVSCLDIGDDPQFQKFMRLVKYAEQYNRRLLELEGKPGK